MRIPLSDRLLAACRFVKPGDRVADVGCDHGYLGIYLLNNNIASHVIASDINEGPLHAAVLNSEKYGVRDRIQFFLSDGVQKIPREFDTLVCAGMGGDTMISILEAAPWLKCDQYRLILQCQSKRPELRQWLYDEASGSTGKPWPRMVNLSIPLWKWFSIRVIPCPMHKAISLLPCWRTIILYFLNITNG